MRTRGMMLLLCVAVGVLAGSAMANSAPEVSNVRASQRADDSKLVDITYNLYDADGDVCTVWVLASINGGATWTVPVFTLIGAAGSNVSPGSDKHIVWDAGADVPGRVGDIKVRVLADDGQGGMAMVFVPGGTFMYQGSTRVHLESYFIGKYEVTCQEYCEFLNHADHWGDHYGGYPEIEQYGVAGEYTYTVLQGKKQYPVRNVSYYDAVAYAAWLSEQTGRHYRLPTEQEWEKAAGWDPDLQKLWTYGFQQDNISSAWCNYDNAYGGPLPVGSFDGTGNKNDAYSYYGCYDMTGNVCEWTSSIYSGSSRVIRGGSCVNYASYCRVANRGSGAPSNRSSYFGFRLVLDLD